MQVAARSRALDAETSRKPLRPTALASWANSVALKCVHDQQEGEARRNRPIEVCSTCHQAGLPGLALINRRDLSRRSVEEYKPRFSFLHIIDVQFLHEVWSISCAAMIREPSKVVKSQHKDVFTRLVRIDLGVPNIHKMSLPPIL